MKKKHRIKLIRIIITILLFIIIPLLKVEGKYKVFLYLLPYLIAGYDVLWIALKNLLRGQMFDENFLMSIATIGALIIGEYPEAVFVMAFYQVGDMFESIAVGRSRKSISELMELNPDFANVERDGNVIEVMPEEIEKGEIILVKPGEKIAIDGVIIEGESTVDTSALTGESLPRDVFAGDLVSSGCVNINGVLRIQTVCGFKDSTASKIMELVENSALNKAKSEKFITRFSRYYTPCVVICALLMAVIPPIIIGNWSQWLSRALIFLVVSCPCALVISVPLSFFGGIGAASKRGILIKGSSYIEVLANVKTVVFDKTGTLTKGNFYVKSICPYNMTEENLLKYAAAAEEYSNHPIALSLESAYKGNCCAENVEELSGYGVKATVEGKRVHVGNVRLMDSIGIKIPVQNYAGTVVHVAVDEEYAGYILVADEIKDEAKNTIKELKEKGIEKTVMLTGDKEEVAKNVAEDLGIDEYYSELMPDQKVGCIEKLFDNKGRVAFMGDGINDAPVLARADVGIAMGALGADVAIEAADVVIMDDNPLKLAQAINIALKTRKIVIQNIVFALGIKFAVLILGTLGIATMWEAVFADVGVSVIAILNAMRTLKIK